MSGLGRANVLHFTKDEVSVFKGTPEFLVEDSSFLLIRIDASFREKLLDELNVKEITVGRIGIKLEGGYFFLPDETPLTVDSPKRRDLGEYLRLGPNKRI